MIVIRRLNWDTWNVAHIARHQVLPEEAEEVCHGDPVELRSYKGRIILVGPSQAGRLLAVVLEHEGDAVYYPVTARPASRKERRYYEQQKGGVEK